MVFTIFNALEIEACSRLPGFKLPGEFSLRDVHQILIKSAEPLSPFFRAWQIVFESIFSEMVD
jgi:hypothetical protein